MYYLQERALELLEDAHDFGVQFDGENNSIADPKMVSAHEGLDTLCGIHATNGVEWFGFIAGGDWEHPVFCVVWEDGHGQIQGVAPIAGNMFNTQTMAAYGNAPNCFDAADEIGRDGLPEWEPSLLRVEIERMVK